MSLLSRLFGKSAPSKNQPGVFLENSIVALLVVVGSPSHMIDESDAIGMYASKNPSWSRSQPVRLLRTAQAVPPTTDGLQECIRLMANSDLAKSVGPCMVVAQPSGMEVLNETTGKRSGQAALCLFTFFSSRSGKMELIFFPNDDAIQFQPEEGRIRRL